MTESFLWGAGDLGAGWDAYTSITAAGRTLLRRLEELGDQANEALLAPLTPAEREQLGALLTRLIAEEAEGVR
ncbi:hypothetical protein ACQEVM_35725 [Streptomyces sp. CA-243310]|uniref:hypothetical protein n=1 Tax=Streptomyces sp. CA-243310 TaxID=3240056 RepID=UPI003D93555B